MKYRLLIGFILFWSCNRPLETSKAHFKSIEITDYNGWTGGSTIHIDSLGIITICEYRAISTIDSVKCFRDTLEDFVIDSLNYYLNNIVFEQIDTLYDGHCQDCGGYQVEIKTQNKILHSLIIGRNSFSNDFLDLVQFVTNIKMNKNVLDTIMVFETTKILVPPPMPPDVKYTPPEY